MSSYRVVSENYAPDGEQRVTVLEHRETGCDRVEVASLRGVASEMRYFRYGTRGRVVVHPSQCELDSICPSLRLRADGHPEEARNDFWEMVKANRGSVAP